jgi:hypothetical protein
MRVTPPGWRCCSGTTLLGLPVLWWLLGVGIYPAILITGRWHAGRAERVDDELR